jgi:signal transduction histidine kinase
VEWRAHLERELHDVLGHSLSVISLQAGAARSNLDRSPDRARECLQSIESVCREASAELRGLLDRLPPAGADASALAGQRGLAGPAPPGLARLDDLIAQVELAGLHVELRTSGVAASLPVATDRCAYRVVQESLTNVLRHGLAGPARVAIGYGRRHVDLTVACSTASPAGGRRALGWVGSGSGRGLRGMRDRLVAVGGRLTVDRHGGQFTVRARLPRLAGPR